MRPRALLRRAAGSDAARLALLVLGPLALGLAACSGGEADGTEAVLARDRAAVHAAEGRLSDARAALAPLVARKGAAAEDLLRAAAVEFADARPDAARALLERARRELPDDPRLHFMLGKLAHERGDFEAAVEHFRAVAGGAPEDLATVLALGSALDDLGRTEEAESAFRELVAVGLDNGGAWYLAGLYRLERLLYTSGRDDEAQELATERLALQTAGFKPPTEEDTRIGALARVAGAAREGTRVPGSTAPLAFAAATLDLPDLRGALELSALDLDGDADLDLLGRMADGVVLALHDEDGWSSQRVYDGAVDLVHAFDLDNEPANGDELCLLLSTPDGLRFVLGEFGSWSEHAVATPPLPSAPRDVIAVDYEHEGWLDLLLVGDFGARLWRNEGAPDGMPDPKTLAQIAASRRFVDATAEAGLPTDRAFAWCATEDFDADDDVDLLLGGPDALFLADNLRGGTFRDASARFGAGARLPRRPVLADLDGDGRTDAWMPGAPAVTWRQRPDGDFAGKSTPFSAESPVQAIDIDLDGSLDVAWPGGAVLAAGLPQARAFELPATQLSSVTAFALGDLDRDRQVDLVRAGPDGLELLVAGARRANAMNLFPLGLRSNRRIVGGVVEYRAGPLYRRIYWRGQPQLLGVGERERIDVLRIRYPRGNVLSKLDLDLTDQTLVDDPDAAFEGFLEPSAQIGSCPFLYTWNGATYEFVTDVLGITPLGLPIAPGMLVPPDHDEYVLVRGDQLVPKDGELRVQFTEELREVTYLDRARLDVVDHPAQVEVFPNELFCFPPFPAAHTHTVRAPLAPRRATGSDGLDWTAEVAARDDVHALPFTRRDPVFAGMAEPWFLELEFDAERLRAAKKLRLFLTGWFFWSDASANVAAARTPGVDFVPPIVQVPKGDPAAGAVEWADAGPPVGFPAGKTKTMVVDLSELDALRAHGRLRLFTTLQLHWDRIALAVDDDDAPLVTTSVEPRSARLWARGFSAPLPAGREDLPERFDWDVLATAGRWDQHPGLYTRYGECVELLGAVDDRYVIMGSGDALEVAFDATRLPPLRAGWTRDYLLYLDGWAKDRDHNTVEALNVEPLPFHGMSGYPYGPDEAFPDDAAHRRWRREWNTRPAHRWLPPLAPKLASAVAEASW